MIYREPLLKLSRLVVLYKGIHVYDERFHDGVNIIRGRNSTGKSTIMDFIFFVLGGDFVAWKPEAERCEIVLAEVELNEQVVTLRRKVGNMRQQPMEIFFGTLDDGLREPFTGWQSFPFRRTDSKESFSQLLFRLLGIPQVRVEHESNITMHQLLRLLCVDQLSNVLSVFRDEQFDSALTRKTIGELLYGLHDDSKYHDELALRSARRAMEEAQTEFNSLRAALSDVGEEFDTAAVEQRRTETEERLTRVRTALAQYEVSYDVSGSTAPMEALREAETDLREKKARYAELSRTQSDLEMETQDSVEFIANLERRLSALSDAVAAEEALGRLALRICPECLQPLDSASDAAHCHLCKQPVGESGRQKRVAKLQQELIAQIQESRRLLGEKETRLAELTTALRAVTAATDAAQRRFDDVSERLTSRRDSARDDLLVKRGELESELNYLETQRRFAERVQQAAQRVKDGKAKVQNLEERIRNAQSRQDARRIDAEQAVNRWAVEFLRNDLPLEDEFQIAREVRVDFERDVCTVDGRVSFSASSITFLKAAAHSAVFFASLELPFFRYPKFLAHDNIEDKGMEQGRSQNLQRLIVAASARATVRHQLIFTTSMIADELDKPEFTVGAFYTPENKTLRFPDLTSNPEPEHKS